MHPLTGLVVLGAAQGLTDLIASAAARAEDTPVVGLLTSVVVVGAAGRLLRPERLA
jgi:hypothetical protein